MAQIRRSAPPECPVCGSLLKPHWQSCPECGACHKTGWREDAEEIDTLSALGIDLYEDLDDTTAMPRRKAGHQQQPGRVPAWAWVVAALIGTAYLLRVFLR